MELLHSKNENVDSNEINHELILYRVELIIRPNRFSSYFYTKFFLDSSIIEIAVFVSFEQNEEETCYVCANRYKSSKA